MTILEPQDAFGLWDRVKPLTEWPDTDETAIDGMADGWAGGGKSLGITIEGMGSAGTRSLATWQSGSGHDYSAKLNETERLRATATQMGTIAGHARQFGEIVKNSKQAIVDTINVNGPLFGLMSAFPGVAREGLQNWFASQVANDINAMLDRNAAQIAGLPTAVPEPVSPELEDIRRQAGQLPGGNVTIPPLGIDNDGYRDAWIRDNRAAIQAAADKYGLGADLLAGIAWSEVAGKPYWLDRYAYDARRVAEALVSSFSNGQTIADPNDSGGSNTTSFGPLSIQVRRAAEALGYPPDFSVTQAEEVIRSLEDPKQNIFIAAAHLADLKQEAGIHGYEPPQSYHELAARYNGGPNWEGGQAQRYADVFERNLTKAQRALYG